MPFLYFFHWDENFKGMVVGSGLGLKKIINLNEYDLIVLKQR